MMFHRDQGPDKMLGGKSGADKKKWFEWSRIHNFTSILIIIGYQLYKSHMLTLSLAELDLIFVLGQSFSRSAAYVKVTRLVAA
jgi:hypothetical protein